MYDTNSLQQALNTNVTNSVTSGIQDQLGKIFALIVIPSIIITLVLIILYLLHVLRRRKIENAILEIRDTLRDSKLPQASPVEPSQKPQRTPEPASSISISGKVASSSNGVKPIPDSEVSD